MNILHLSDIHFGRNHYGIAEPFDRKQDILEQLITFITSMDDTMRPDIIITTGDIAWHGLKTEFDEAYIWYQKLKSALNLANDSFVFCPGNHDLNRNTAIDFSEQSLQNNDKQIDIEKCDHYYEYEQAHILEPRFHNYNVFCEKMGMQPYSYLLNNGSKEYSYLIGSSQFEHNNQPYTISCFNTAYLPCESTLLEDQMFLGLPQIKSQISNGVLSSVPDDIYRIALFHHADRFLHPNEQSEYDGRPATLPLLLSSVDLALCGHTETGGVPVLRTYRRGGNLLTAGAVYYNDAHPNSFSIIHLEKNADPQVFSFYYDRDKWCPFVSNPDATFSPERNKIIWHDSIHKRKTMGFGAYIDGALKIIYSGYFDMETIVTDTGEQKALTNAINPARGIDIGCEPRPGKLVADLKLKHAPGQFQTTASLLTLSSFRQFISENIADAQVAYSGWYNLSNMELLYCIPMDIKTMQQQYIGRKPTNELYEKLQSLEHFYGVQFRLPHPFSLSEEDCNTINWLFAIQQNGCLELSIPDIAESFFCVHNEAEINWIKNVYAADGILSYHFIRNLAIALYGATIRLGKCHIYCSGAKPKSAEEINRKISTWETGDVRQIATDFKGGEDILIIPEKYAKGKHIDRPHNVYYVELPDDAPLLFNDYIKKHITEYSDSAASN